jgi:hypothetical protein
VEEEEEEEEEEEVDSDDTGCYAGTLWDQTVVGNTNWVSSVCRYCKVVLGEVSYTIPTVHGYYHCRFHIVDYDICNPALLGPDIPSSGVLDSASSLAFRTHGRLEFLLWKHRIHHHQDDEAVTACRAGCTGLYRCLLFFLGP